MKKLTTVTLFGIAAAFAATAIAPTIASANEASHRQSKKNQWRNTAIGAGAVALYGLHNHDKATTLLGAAGAAYSAKRYEDERHHQSQARAARSRYHRAASTRAAAARRVAAKRHVKHNNGHHYGWYKNHHNPHNSNH
jgi:hypothetical protein